MGNNCPIAVLQKAIDSGAYSESEVRELSSSIALLSAPQTGANPLPDIDTAGYFMEMQIRAVQNDKDYPAERFSGMTLEGIAIALARSFDGCLTASAYRKVIEKPGVRKGSKQSFNIASRILRNSDKFERIWRGFYRLK